jgi:hypothetical protein
VTPVEPVESCHVMQKKREIPIVRSKLLITT